MHGNENLIEVEIFKYEPFGEFQTLCRYSCPYSSVPVKTLLYHDLWLCFPRLSVREGKNKSSFFVRSTTTESGQDLLKSGSARRLFRGTVSMINKVDDAGLLH